jgi:hypothetical protein
MIEKELPSNLNFVISPWKHRNLSLLCYPREIGDTGKSQRKNTLKALLYNGFPPLREGIVESGYDKSIKISIIYLINLYRARKLSVENIAIIDRNDRQ